MLFTTKLASALLAITASTHSASSAVIARNELSVIFYDDVKFNGASFSPDSLVEGTCSTLPGDWLDRPQSINIDSGFSCIFFTFQGCDGEGTTLSGKVRKLSQQLTDNIESFFCSKVA